MPEWLNGLAWNASIRVTVSGVRISFSPQNFAFKMFDFVLKNFTYYGNITAQVTCSHNNSLSSE